MSNGDNGGTPIDTGMLGDPSYASGVTIASMLAYLAQPPVPPDRPVKAYEHPADAAKFTYQGIYYALTDLGIPAPLAGLLAAIAAFIVLLGGTLGYIILWIFTNVLPEIASAGLDFIDGFRKQLDPQVAGISVQILNELMGTDYSEVDLPAGEDVGSHIARADKIGHMYLNTIMQSITPGTDLETVDGLAGAARFTGLIVNFGVATALLGIAGELSSAGLFKDFRLIGEQVSSGLGLSRQMRLVLKPILKTLVATPFQWQLNKQFFPTRFTPADVVNPFSNTLMDHATIVGDLALQGYSPARAEALIRLHSKKPTIDDIKIGWKWGVFSDTQAIQQLTAIGFTNDVAAFVQSGWGLAEADSALTALADDLVTRYGDGHITLDELTALLGSLPLSAKHRDVLLQIAQLKLKTPHVHLTLAEMQSAFNEGLVNLDQLDAFLTARGYTADDAAILEALTLLKFAQFEEAKKVAQFNYDQKVAAAKKKGTPIPPIPKMLAG